MSFEPDDTKEYNKQEYWDTRYTQEARYDWFPSVYDKCVEVITASCVKRAEAISKHTEGRPKLRVLHLGCGNSALCFDLAKAVAKHNSESQLPFTILQTAMDYSPVCIQRMKEQEAALNGSAPSSESTCAGIDWQVGDIRDLSSITPHAASDDPSERIWDVIIDKGTMDALEADKETAEENCLLMLKSVTKVLHPDGGCFVQVTWVNPYYRKHTLMNADEEDVPGGYGWENDEAKSTSLSDMYYYYEYFKRPKKA